MTAGAAERAVVAGRNARVLAIGAYVLLGLALLVTRLTGLGRGYWLDEIETVRDFILKGPSEILAGDRVNHELFSLLGWATTQLVGESEVALRLWSVIPFLAGVALVTAWLHVRVGALSGILFLFFCTASPLLLDITRQARGYGLAFLAMAVMVVSALEAERTRRGSLIALFCAAGVVGTLTLPNMVIAFVATGAILGTKRQSRRALGAGLTLSLLVIAATYAPQVRTIQAGSGQDYSAPIDTSWLVTAPVDQILLPALIWIDGTLLVPGVVWLPLVLGVVMVLVMSPLLHELRTALVLCSGLAATVVAIWASQVDVVPRFLSYLLVPMFMLLATGAATILMRLRTRPLVIRTLLAAGLLALTVVFFATQAPNVVRHPREAHRDAARTVLARTAPTTPVFAYMTRPSALEFYLGRPVTRPASRSDPEVCNRREPVALVVQPWVLPPAAFPCINRTGTRHFSFEQYARGGEIAVWIIPPQ
jgi:hypothetical protein